MTIRLFKGSILLVAATLSSSTTAWSAGATGPVGSPTVAAAIAPDSPEAMSASTQVLEGLDDLQDMIDNGELVAANGNVRTRRAPARRTRPGTRAVARPRTSAARPVRGDARLAKARSLAKSGQYQEASKLLFAMSRSPQYARESTQIKYILGLMLFEMKLNQSAAFVFYDVVRQESRTNTKSRYLRAALGKLAMAGDALDSDVLLRYAIKQVREEEFPAASRDMLYYRTGELKMQEKDFMEAARQFSRVRANSIFYSRARYKLALALTEAGQLDKAVAAFDDLASQSSAGGVTNKNRVSAILGKARVLYQKQDFSGALEAYRDVPRDTEQWHEALFESTWAMLRDGRFRSALSNFHSLHSPYYEDFYQPESLLLRAIVYLYICRYDEMEKVVDLFEKVYKPVRRDIRNFLKTVNDPIGYYREIAKVSDNFDEMKAAGAKRKPGQVPFLVARQILKEGDVRRTFNYLQKLEEEKKRIESLPASWTNSGVGKYSKKIVEKRIEATRGFAGKQIRRHMAIIQNELRELFEQSGFLRFEMISGKKESLRKEIAGKGITHAQVDQDNERSFYIQNGYEYWPFQGEYWLDEIGNYHYVGVKACE